MKMKPRLINVLLSVQLGLILSVGLFFADGATGRTPPVQGQTPTFWQVFSPLSNTPGGLKRDVTSPTQYHNGAGCLTSLYDSTTFDGSCAPTAGGDWSMDIGAPGGGQTVWVDIQSADLTTDFRVIAGNRGSYTPSGCWAGGPNYQYFNLQYYNGSSWVGVGWLLIGHINATYSSGTTVLSSTGTRASVAVGTVASSICPHVHVEMYNNSAYSIAHDFDGPSNANDSTLGPPYCALSGTESFVTDCNAELDAQWVIGHLGGAAGSFFEMNNPYYGATPDF